jgi:hypothetical protein
MIEGRSFLFQDLERIVYHINEAGVQVMRGWSSGEIVAFVETDEENYEPRTMLLENDVQIILASSPKGTAKKWTKQIGGIYKMVTKPWLPHELFLAGFV